MIVRFRDSAKYLGIDFRNVLRIEIYAPQLSFLTCRNHTPGPQHAVQGMQQVWPLPARIPNLKRIAAGNNVPHLAVTNQHIASAFMSQSGVRNRTYGADLVKIHSLKANGGRQRLDSCTENNSVTRASVEVRTRSSSGFDQPMSSRKSGPSLVAGHPAAGPGHCPTPAAFLWRGNGVSVHLLDRCTKNDSVTRSPVEVRIRSSSGFDRPMSSRKSEPSLAAGHPAAGPDPAPDSGGVSPSQPAVAHWTPATAKGPPLTDVSVAS